MCGGGPDKGARQKKKKEKEGKYRFHAVVDFPTRLAFPANRPIQM
jgi:hypothetical protein